MRLLIHSHPLLHREQEKCGGVQLLCSGMFRCAQLGTRVAKLNQEMKEEQEMNRCLRANQTQLQTQLAEEERKGKESGEERALPENLTHTSAASRGNQRCRRVSLCSTAT